jgi:hypothetical protein
MKKPAVLSGMEIWVLAFTAVAALVSIHWRSAEATLGVIAGGLLMAGNFMAIRHVVKDLMGEADEPSDDRRRKKRRSWLVAQYVLKMVAMLAIIAGLLSWGRINAIGLLAGITVALAALVIAGLRAAAFDDE